MSYQLNVMQPRSPKQLAKLLNYILGRRPDEFGLVAAKDGFIKIKELIKAVNEEEGLQYVRRAHINEVMISLPNHGLEVVDDLIRAENRQDLPKQSFALDPPKLLYTCVRKKAYPFVKDKGIRPSGYPKIVLASTSDLAYRIGKRSDHAAVLLTVQVNHSEDKGVVFFKAGESLFLADYIPPDGFSGPPLAKELAETRNTDKSKKEPAKIPAGSFLLDLNKNDRPATPGARQKKRDKKQKQRRERPPWRR
jgi:putative RNA 2'-phosphotransferase